MFTAFPLALESPELSTTAYCRTLSLFLFFDLSLLLFLLFLYHFLIIFILISSLYFSSMEKTLSMTQISMIRLLVQLMRCWCFPLWLSAILIILSFLQIGKWSSCLRLYMLHEEPLFMIPICVKFHRLVTTKGDLRNGPVIWKWSESENHSVVPNSLPPHGLYSPWNCPGQNNGVGSLSLLQEIFQTQGSNPGLPHSRWILYQLSHKGSLRDMRAMVN